VRHQTPRDVPPDPGATKTFELLEGVRRAGPLASLRVEFQ
jgi:hypothetical protein